MNGSASVSILIPTRERASTLKYTIASCLSQCYNNLTVIVCDNCSQDNTVEIVKSFNDTRLVYINSGKRLSMSDNWEFALNHVKSDFVTIIGDDDAFLPNAISDAVGILKQFQKKALSWKKVEYTWPNYPKQHWSNTMILPKENELLLMPGKTVLELIFKSWLGYNYGPCIYNSIISMDLIKDIKSREGRIFKSKAPDVYSSLIFASVLKDYLYSNRPFSINGASASSNGTSSIVCASDGDNQPRKDFVKEYFGSDYETKVDFSLVQGSITAAVTESFVTLVESSKFISPKINFKKSFKRILEECCQNKTLTEKNIELLQKLAQRHGVPRRLILENIATRQNNHESDGTELSLLKGNLSRGEIDVDLTRFGIENVNDASIFAGKLMGSYQLPSKLIHFNKARYFASKIIQKFRSSKYYMQI